MSNALEIGAIEVATMEVKRDDWGVTRVVTDVISSALGDAEVLLKTDRFALTANNISYAVSGDLLGYWGFFPTESGWGRIPAMAYGEVLASAHPEITVGERVWGFFPMSTHLKIRAGNVNSVQFVDVSEHREEYAPIYSQYQRASGNPIYQADREDQDCLLRGLFLTSWLCEDYMTDNNTFDAEAYVITSASSKTSIALAFTVMERGEKQAIGITSARNAAFCEGLGCYSQVLTYESLETLDPGQGVVLVDMSGNAQLISQLHQLYGDNMRFSSMIGATHYQKMGSTEGLPGATPEFFFAPAQAQKRSAEWGPGEIEMRMGASFVGFREFCDSWLRIDRAYGPDDVCRVYQEVLSGESDPDLGHILSLWDCV